MSFTKHWLQSKIGGDIFALIAGLMLAFSFAPFNYYILAFISPAILLATWLSATPKRAFWRGFLCGLGFFGIGVSWVFVSIHVYGYASVPFSILATAIFVMWFALYIAMQGYLLNQIFPSPSQLKILLAFPAIWVLMEWFRSWFLTGFTWLTLGYSQINSPLSGYGPIIGVFGISLITTFISSLLVSLFFTKSLQTRGLIFSTLILILIAGQGLRTINWTKPSSAPIKVSLIQGNVKQEVKWQPQQIQNILQTYWQLTNQHWDSDLIVWPEAAITITNFDAKDFLQELDQTAKQHRATVITGIPILKINEYYNGVIALGMGHGEYLKRHLVPLGEYVPLRFIFDFFNHYVQIPMADMSKGPKHQPELHSDGITIAPFICYEIIFPEEVLDSLPQAQMLLVVSDDSWFGTSIAAAQHLQMGQMRALETGRYLLFSTNNGMTAIIDPKGKIQAGIPAFTTMVLTGTAQGMQGSTPFVIIGIYPILILALLMLGIGIYRTRNPKSKKSN